MSLVEYECKSIDGQESTFQIQNHYSTMEINHDERSRGSMSNEKSSRHARFANGSAQIHAYVKHSMVRDVGSNPGDRNRRHGQTCQAQRVTHVYQHRNTTSSRPIGIDAVVGYRRQDHGQDHGHGHGHEVLGKAIITVTRSRCQSTEPLYWGGIWG
jgi:hypothetical protein